MAGSIADLDDDDLNGDTGEGSKKKVVAQGRPRPALTVQDLPEPEEIEATGPLSEKEEGLLAVCMRGIQQMQDSWWVGAKAAANIKARRLYRKTHPTFDAFCRDVFDQSAQTKYEEIAAYTVGELVSARADNSFEGDSNSAAGIPKKAASALNPITTAHGPEVSVAVYETISDAAGKRVPVRQLTGIIQQLPQPTDDHTPSREDLVSRARALAGRLTKPPQQGDGPPSALTALEGAVKQLSAAHRALAPSKVREALEEDAERATAALREAAELAEKSRRRAAQS